LKTSSQVEDLNDNPLESGVKAKKKKNEVEQVWNGKIFFLHHFSFFLLSFNRQNLNNTSIKRRTKRSKRRSKKKGG